MNDTLKIKSILTGDRCNGGIVHAEQQGEKLIYTINITPADFFDLAKQSLDTFKPYENLASSPNCCVAKASFAVNPVHDSEYPSLMNIQFNDEVNDALNNNSIYQSCFNSLVALYKNQEESVLSQERLQDFLKQFMSTCLK